MSLRDAAVQIDSREEPQAAAAAYEAAIAGGEESLATFLDLAVLYWVCTDGGYMAHHHLPNDFVSFAERRARELLDEAEERVGAHSEIEFWRYYFDHISYGLPARAEFCQELAERGPSLVPYFHLYALAADEQYRPQAEALRTLVEARRTERERYVWSVLGSSLRRKTRRA